MKVIDEGIKDIANGLGASRAVTQLLPVVWTNLIECVLHRPVGFDKCRQQWLPSSFRHAMTLCAAAAHRRARVTDAGDSLA